VADDDAKPPRFGDALDAMKAAMRPARPGDLHPDIAAMIRRSGIGPFPDSQTPVSLRVCPYCHRHHESGTACEPRAWDYPTADPVPKRPAPLPPLDPFTPGAEASAALAEMYSDMCASGIPVASVESILGHMLAAYQLGKDGVQ
jgi:hypothetical protein